MNSRANKNVRREHDPNNAANYGGVSLGPVEESGSAAPPLQSSVGGGSAADGQAPDPNRMGGVAYESPASVRDRQMRASQGQQADARLRRRKVQKQLKGTDIYR